MSTATALGGLALARAARRYERYAIAGSSMEPALNDGDWVVVDATAYRRSIPRPGHVVLAQDPRDHSREVVKRVVRVDLHGETWLEGDNPAESTDSRTFGCVPPGLVRGRVVWRYWPRLGRVH